MRFQYSALFFLAASLPLGLGAAVAATKRDQIDPVTCIEAEKYVGIYHNAYSPACAGLVFDCLHKLNATASTDIWGQSTCVAAATCDGANLLTVAQCQNPKISKANAPHLNYNIYAGIVGDCAWQQGGCPITAQNYIDFLYGQLSSIGSTSWPSSAQDALTAYWNPIMEWTATGNTVPYTNFDDWLHYAPQ